MYAYAKKIAVVVLYLSDLTMAAAAAPDFNRPLGPQPAVSEETVRQLSGKKVEELHFRLAGLVVRVPDMRIVSERIQRGLGKEAVADMREIFKPTDTPPSRVAGHGKLVYDALPRQLARRNMSVSGEGDECQDPCLSIVLDYAERQKDGEGLEITLAARLIYQGVEVLWSRGDWGTQFSNVQIMDGGDVTKVATIYFARKTVHEIAHALWVRYGVIIPPEPSPETVK